MVNTPTSDMKTPCVPKASAPYNRVISGVKTIVMACAAAVPVAIVMTLRTNGRLLTSLRFFSTKTRSHYGDGFELKLS